jgi:hypothetical protein
VVVVVRVVVARVAVARRAAGAGASAAAAPRCCSATEGTDWTTGADGWITTCGWAAGAGAGVVMIGGGVTCWGVSCAKAGVDNIAAPINSAARVVRITGLSFMSQVQ